MIRDVQNEMNGAVPSAPNASKSKQEVLDLQVQEVMNY